MRLFRPDENAKRMISGAEYLDMPAPSVEMFVEFCKMCIQANMDFVPPYESGASLYLRPVLFGCNPQLGVHSADDVLFAVMASGVGTYSGAKALSPGNAVISRNYDRAATYGSGGYKLGANYAQSLHAYNLAHKSGYRDLLFLDTATHTHIEEFGASNFFELAVAVAIALFGTTSPAALATTVGVLTEVPVMLTLVRIANKSKERF